MKLTSRTEYALMALLYLARQGSKEPVSVDSIAEARGIPARFLEQIMMALKRAGHVRSIKGKYGGFLLARSAKEISLAEVIRLFDGALAPTESVSEYFYSETPIEKEKKVLRVFRDIRDYVANKLERTTLADIM